MKKKIEEILDILIEEIKKGKSVDDCLKEYPEHSAELRSLLLLASGIEEIPQPEIDLSAFEKTMTKINWAKEESAVRKPFFVLRTLITKFPVRRLAFAVLIFTITITITFSFSAYSLPGDTLYPVRRLGEDAQLALTIRDESKIKLHIKRANRRTEDFILTFKKGAKIDRELIKAMLGEVHTATKYCKCLPEQKSTALFSKVQECSQYQLKILQNIKPFVCDSDLPFISEAINECSLRCSCVE
jgi:hypothetical protein